MMTPSEETRFKNELTRCAELTYRRINSIDYRGRFAPPDMSRAVYHYVDPPRGKALRPMLVMTSCRAVGGSDNDVLPLAAGVELYHTWTLVHDDIIDRDDLRRKGTTIHEEFRRLSAGRGLSPEEAQHYGLTIALLAGDVLHGWAISFIGELGNGNRNDSRLPLRIISDLENFVLNGLVEGETLDVQFSGLPVEKVSEEMVLDMLYKKTGLLYEYCARWGAYVGGEGFDPESPTATALAEFARHAGVAFQLQDDILGVIGGEEKTGKSAMSDLREGKRTTIVSHALQRASSAQSRQIMGLLGNKQASTSELKTLAGLLGELDGINHTRQLAERIIKEQALPHLSQVRASKDKGLLELWAKYMISRDF